MIIGRHSVQPARPAAAHGCDRVLQVHVDAMPSSTQEQGPIGVNRCWGCGLLRLLHAAPTKQSNTDVRTCSNPVFFRLAIAIELLAIQNQALLCDRDARLVTHQELDKIERV